MTEIQQTEIILLITAFVMVAIAGIAFIVRVLFAWLDREKKPKREKKGLKCLAGIHKWRYVSTPLREVWYSDRRRRFNKTFTVSYYNKKVEYEVKYCLKCLKFKAEKI